MKETLILKVVMWLIRYVPTYHLSKNPIRRKGGKDENNK